MVTKEEFTELLDAMKAISHKEWALIKKFDERMNTVYDHRQLLRTLMGSLLEFLNSTNQGGDSQVEKSKREVIGTVRRIQENILPAFDTLIIEEEHIIAETEKYLRQSKIISSQWGPALSTDVGAAELADFDSPSVQKLVSGLRDRLKFEKVEEKASEHLEKIIAAMKSIHYAQNEIIHSEREYLNVILSRINQLALSDTEIKSWIFNLKELEKNIEATLREEKSRVIGPMKKFVGEHEHADVIARRTLKKTTITKKDIARDVATFTEPYEFQRYQAHLIRHQSLLDPKALDYLLKLSFASAKTAHHRFFSLDTFKKLAFIDSLTKAYNRHYVSHEWKKLISSAERSGKGLSLALFDIDFFKQFNDTYSHDVGDQVLVEVFNIISKTVRGHDLVVRWGGEEILVIFPETDLEGVAIISEKIRLAVQQGSVELMKKVNLQFTKIAEGKERRINITLSGGTATFPEEGSILANLMDRADKKLYWAKEHGRNRIETVKLATK
jgi:diguanylate cyclase (GGDEF)-like protein